MYSLRENLKTISDFLDDVSETNEVKTDLKTGEDVNGKYVQYAVTTKQTTEFKAKIFKCTNVSYNSDGRINGMKFEEQDITDDDIET